MHQHFENWNDMKHEPQNFWSAETIFYFNVKLFPYTISDGESQTPLLWFFLRGGGSVHRLDNDKSRYVVITELNNNCFIIWSTCISLESKAICHFHTRRKVWVLLRMSRILFAARCLSQTQLDDIVHEQTIICRQLFAGHVEGFWPMKRKKNLLQMILMIMA